MSRINTNVGSLLAQRILSQNNSTLNKSLERLSTGLRINRGADGPAALIASETLRAEKVAIDAAIDNAERADQVINIAEGGLQEINALLLELQSLVGQTASEAGQGAEEKRANQLQIDSILQTIDRIAESTSFQGTKLLNGTYDFTVSAQSSFVSDFTINAAKVPFGQNRDVEVIITQSAQRAGLLLSIGGTQLNLSAPDAQFVIELAGTRGSREFTFASGTTISSIATAINTFKEVIGISATTSTTGIVLKTSDFGSNEFVSVDIIDAGSQGGGVLTLSTVNENIATPGSQTTFLAVAAAGALRDDGQDVGAIINGIAATARGRTADISTAFLDVELELTTSGAQNLGALAALTITGGGAVFNLGPNVDISNKVSIGIGNVAARHLGTVSLGNLDDLGSGKTNNVVDGDLTGAQNIVSAGINQVSSLRGRLGAFQKNVIGATVRSLGVAFENTSAAESAIRDTDFASETAELTRSQILVNAATNVLAIANSQPQSVLALLG